MERICAEVQRIIDKLDKRRPVFSVKGRAVRHAAAGHPESDLGGNDTELVFAVRRSKQLIVVGAAENALRGDTVITHVYGLTARNARLTQSDVISANNGLPVTVGGGRFELIINHVRRAGAAVAVLHAVSGTYVRHFLRDHVHINGTFVYLHLHVYAV